MVNMGKTAVLFGATGLIGRACLTDLLQHPAYGRVISIGRRSTGRQDPKLVEVMTSLDKLAEAPAAAVGAVDDVFCALGTTQAKAGSPAAFRSVDRDMPMLAARFGKAHGARHFLLVSAIGADARSPILYNKVKGEAEAAVVAEGVPVTSIFRPSLLLGHRDEFRWKEKLGEPLMRLASIFMIGPARRLRPIEATDVARAMVRVAQMATVGSAVYSSDRIADLASQ